MKSSILAAVMAVWACPAFAQESGSDSQESEPARHQSETVQAVDETESSKVAEALPGDEDFKPPAGFKKKKRGKYVVYCIKDSSIGTRFKTEKCYDEEQMKDYLLAREENNRNFDQRRAICSNQGTCVPQ